ncbi:hypothetical protein [Sulfitobacter sp. S190]|uniref:hypothetical protein n=1 Tax=Sulfitobacter sp. S190 TaxID=2867022 RepID=UPI0021A584A3|nr:hypothetical protein [Sulfitobacter sp. S190]UWR23287.1 hypothetical protein K3756_04655 [Sulfitobacter sp. S190]
MLVFSQQNLVLLSVPKTGSTAMEAALKPWADIAFYKHRKHMPLRRYRRKVAPFLASEFDLRPETMAVVRAPLDHLRSWYRYRAADLAVDFDGFVQAALADNPPDWAQIGSQWNFVTDSRDQPAIDHLFSYEKQTVLRAFLCARMEADIRFKPLNVSPDAPTPISDDTLAAFNGAYADEIALHARIISAGGHLRA